MDRAEDPYPHALGLPLPPARVERLLQDVVLRLGVRQPLMVPLGYLVEKLSTVLPAGQDAAFFPPARFVVRVNDDDLIRHELGRFLAYQNGHAPGSRASAAWARRAEGRPLWWLPYLMPPGVQY